MRQELPITNPNFGKLQVCVCRQKTFAQNTQTNLLRFSNLVALKDMTFDRFNPRGRIGLSEEATTSLQNALNQATLFAGHIHGWLLLTGACGCGKTHLAAAVANAAVQNGVRTLFLTVPDLLDWLRFAYSDADTSYESRFEEIRNVDLLVLDDLGTQNSTAWAQEKLFQILDYRYLRHLPTVLTTNLALAEIEDRIRSRLTDPDLVTVVKITAPDFRSPVAESHDRLLYDLSMLSDRTFGTFSLREPERLPADDQKSLEKAFQATQQFAEAPRGWLVMMGDYGTGKTHLAAAIGNYRKGMGEEPILIAVPDLLDYLRATFSPSSNVSFDERFERVKTVPLLILDDFSTQSATPWSREKLYQIFNYRYMARLPMVITTTSKLDELDARIRTRLLDERICKIYYLLVPSYRPSQPKAERPRRTH